MAWRGHASFLSAGFLWLGVSSCGLIVGIEDLNDDALGGAGGAGAGSSSSPGGSGPGGQGGSGGGPGACADQPDGTECYEGPPGTLGVGLCQAGTCLDGECSDQAMPYTEDCTSVDVDENCDGEPRCNGQGLWSATIRGAGAQDDIHVTVNGEQAILVTGTFEGTIQVFGSDGAPGDELANTTGAKPTDVFLAKLDPEGVVLWGKRFGDEAEQSVVGIDSYGSPEFAIAGNFSGVLDLGGSCTASSAAASSGYAALFDGDGNCLWLRAFPASVTSVAVGQYSDVVFVGGSYQGIVEFNGLTSPEATDSDAFLLTIDHDGDSAPGDLATSSGPGNERITHVEWGGGVTWALGTYDSDTAVVADESLGYEPGSFEDVFVARLDGDSPNAFDLVKYFGGPGPDLPRGVAVNTEGHVILAVDHTEDIPAFGEVEPTGGIDSFMVEFPNSGDGALWVMPATGPADQSQTAVDVDSADNAVFTLRAQGATTVIGASDIPGDASDDILVQKIYSDLSCWMPPLRLATTGREVPLDIAVDGLGNVVVAGSYDTAGLGMGDGIPALPAPHGDGLSDLFITKRRP